MVFKSIFFLPRSLWIYCYGFMGCGTYFTILASSCSGWVIWQRHLLLTMSGAYRRTRHIVYIPYICTFPYGSQWSMLMNKKKKIRSRIWYGTDWMTGQTSGNWSQETTAAHYTHFCVIFILSLLHTPTAAKNKFNSNHPIWRCWWIKNLQTINRQNWNENIVDYAQWSRSRRSRKRRRRKNMGKT